MQRRMPMAAPSAKALKARFDEAEATLRKVSDAVDYLTQDPEALERDLKTKRERARKQMALNALSGTLHEKDVVKMIAWGANCLSDGNHEAAETCFAKAEARAKTPLPPKRPLQEASSFGECSGLGTESADTTRCYFLFFFLPRLF